MTHWTPEEAQSALDSIATRAAKDAAFRTLCLTSPADAVREVTGRELPETFVLRFIDNAQADLTVVLPDLPAAGELTDSDLETVAGGGASPQEIAALHKLRRPDRGAYKAAYEWHLKTLSDRTAGTSD